LPGPAVERRHCGNDSANRTNSDFLEGHLMSSHVFGRRIAVVAMLLVGFAAGAALAANELSPNDRQALREFRLNRLFAMLGYLEQRQSNNGFPWNKVGYGEAGNAWSGVTAEGEKLSPAVRELVRQHEQTHRAELAAELARVFAGTAQNEGVKALAKIELEHAASDVQKVDVLLAGQPLPTVEEFERLKTHEADLLRRFTPFVPGLKPVDGGFTAGGSYRSQAYPNPDSTIYLAESVAASRASTAPVGPTVEQTAQTGEAALAEAREALARLRTLVGHFDLSRQRYTEQLEKTHEALQRRAAATVALDEAMVRMPGLKQTSAELAAELLALSTTTAELEETYRMFAESGFLMERNAATICQHAQQAKDASPEQVRSWKAEANLTISGIAINIKSLRSDVDAKGAEVQRHRDAVVKLVRKLNFYDALTLTLPFLPEAHDAQAQIRAAWNEAEATGREIGIAAAQIKQEEQRIEERLKSYAGDQEADRIRAERDRLVGNLADPKSAIRDVRQQVLGTSGEPTWVSNDMSRYDVLDEVLRNNDVEKAAARAKEAIDEAVAVEAVGEGKAVPAYRAMKTALDCYARIPGSTDSTTATPPTEPPSPASDAKKQTVWVLNDKTPNPEQVPAVRHDGIINLDTVTFSASGFSGQLVLDRKNTEGRTDREYNWVFQFSYSDPPAVLRPGQDFDIHVQAQAGGGKQDYVLSCEHNFTASGIKFRYEGQNPSTKVGRYDVGRNVVSQSEGVFHCQVDESASEQDIWLQVGLFSNGPKPFARYVYEKREVTDDELKKLTAGN
jgi:hypothetical protein